MKRSIDQSCCEGNEACSSNTSNRRKEKNKIRKKQRKIAIELKDGTPEQRKLFEQYKKDVLKFMDKLKVQFIENKFDEFEYHYRLAVQEAKYNHFNSMIVAGWHSLPVPERSLPARPRRKKDFFASITFDFSAEEKDFYESFFSEAQAGNYTINGVDFPKKNLQCLQAFEDSPMTFCLYLNDDVVNSFFALLMMHYNVLSIPSMWVLKFNEAMMKYPLKYIDKLTDNIFKYDFILLPIVENLHWSLVAYNKKENTITHYDSLHMHKPNQTTEKLQLFISAYHANKQPKHEIQGLRTILDAEYPMQENSFDCGVFTCQYAKYIASGKDFDFDQSSMQNFRCEMLLQLLMQRKFNDD